MTDRYTLDELSTLEEAAAQLGLNVRTARHRVRARNLGRMFGTTRILTPEEVQALAVTVPPHIARQQRKEQREANSERWAGKE